MAVAANVWVLTRAKSPGGTRSHVGRQAFVEGPGAATPENLVRFSPGSNTRTN